MARTKPNKLTASVNVPLYPALKRRLIEQAKAHPVKPAHTKFTRLLIEDALDTPSVVESVNNRLSVGAP